LLRYTRKDRIMIDCFALNMTDKLAGKQRNYLVCA